MNNKLICKLRYGHSFNLKTGYLLHLYVLFIKIQILTSFYYYQKYSNLYIYDVYILNKKYQTQQITKNRPKIHFFNYMLNCSCDVENVNP